MVATGWTKDMVKWAHNLVLVSGVSDQACLLSLMSVEMKQTSHAFPQAWEEGLVGSVAFNTVLGVHEEDGEDGGYGE